MPDKITVILYFNRIVVNENSTTPDQNEYHSVYVYPNINTGSDWTYHQPVLTYNGGPKPDILGEFDLTINNVPAYNNGVLNGYPGSILGNGGLSTVWGPIHSSSGKLTYSNGYASINRGHNANLENTTYLMTILDSNLELKYRFFENPELGSDVTLNYNEFEFFDSQDYLPILPSNEQYRFEMYGFDNEYSFRNQVGYLILATTNHPEKSNNVGNNAIPLGYLDRFNYYETLFNIRLGYYAYDYRRYGKKPEIKLPNEPKVTILDERLTKFDISLNLEYVRKTSTWRQNLSENGVSTNWIVHTDNEVFPVIGVLPEEILVKYPKLMNPDEITYTGSTFYLQSETYLDYVDKEFKPQHGLNPTDDLVIEKLIMNK